MTSNELFCAFSGKKVLVLGDVMIDAYLQGRVNRISPEAPVPIVDIEERYYRLGGAANVALNLQSLSATPILCSVIGNDEKGELFSRLMAEKQMDTTALVRSENRKTTIKYRVIGNRLQMLRIDEEDRHPLDEKETDDYLSTIKKIVDNQEIDAIVFEDYDKGVLTPGVIRLVVGWARERGIIVTVDPKKRNFNHYQGVTLFKPNLKELREGMEVSLTDDSEEGIHQVMKSFAADNAIDLVFTTLSERGVAIYDRRADRFYTQPAYLRKISDVSGAGDTVISVATLCLTAGLDTLRTAQIANLSGGIVCEHSGVVPIPPEQMKQEIEKYSLL
jgi:rfaE bifunctional protein kinase chain/domain